MALSAAQIAQQKKQAEELLFSGPQTLGFAKGLDARRSPMEPEELGPAGDRLVNRDNNDFAPRIGIAWSPTPK
jgi:hypothetical protein